MSYCLSFTSEEYFCYIRILDWCFGFFFFLLILWIFHYTLFLLAWFLNRVWWNSYPCFSIGKVFFPSGFFQDFFFFLSLIFCLNRMCVGIDFVLFFLLDVLLTSWICSLLAIINFGKFSVIIHCFKYFFQSFPSSLVFLLHVYHTWSMVLRYYALPLSTFFFFSFCISVFFYWHFFKFTDSFLGHVQSIEEPIKGIPHFCFGVFYF